AAYSWTPKADVTSSSRPSEIGKQMQAVPEHQLSLWADYRLAIGLKLGAGARYTGSTRGYGESAPVKVPGYTLFDAMIGYDFGLWRLAINARN
ncbi:TonB-dependent receptor domain-containing protein, partial [Pseudomonas aeruginosa]|uniref:TonB-dependent receptor domain-containing protein n=1 Tax=Pseudomonas aeruginosa TaxID=287 RepID=UPI0028859271